MPNADDDRRPTRMHGHRHHPLTLTSLTHKHTLTRQDVQLSLEDVAEAERQLARDEDGATAIEYGLIAALIAVAAITAMGALGGTPTNTFTEVQTEMQAGIDG